MYWLLEPKVSQLLSAKAATGISKIIDVRHYKNSTIVISTAWTANATIKVQWAIWEVNDVKDTAIGNTTGRIDFAASQSITNDWFYVWSTNVATAAAIVWATWVVYAGTDAVTAIKLNVDSIDFICLNITAISAWTVSATISCHNI